MMKRISLQWIARADILQLTVCVLLSVACHRASAAVYFVSSSQGSDASAGTSADQPWQTLSRIHQAVLSTGDRVYLRAGDVWDDEFLEVDWSGSAAAHAALGAYRIDAAGTVHFDAAAAWDADAGPDAARPDAARPDAARPIIDEHYRWYGGALSAVTASNPALIVSGSYVDIENIGVRHSGWGISVVGPHQSNISLSNILIDGAYQCGIAANRVSGLIIQHSELFNAEAFRGIFGQYGNWCSTIGIQASHGILVQHNFIHESWGEGIDVYYGSSDAQIRDNLLWANAAVGIYFGALNGAAIHGNLVLGSSDPRFWRTPFSTGPGIAMDNEAYEFVGGPTSSHGQLTGTGSLCPLGAYGDYNSEGTQLCPSALQNIDVYDNLVADTAAGLGVWYADYPAAYTHLRIFNNTFVDNEQQLYLGGQRADDAVVQNNVFLSLSEGTVDTTGSNYGMTFASNYWSQGSPSLQGSDALASPTDTLAGAVLARMSGWRNIGSATAVAASDFMPTWNSSTLNAGTSQRLFFAADYLDRPLRTPVDLGGLAGAVQSAPSPAPPPTSPPPGAAAHATPDPASPGAIITVSGSFTTYASAAGAQLYFWLKRPDGRVAAETSVPADFSGGSPTAVTAALQVPDDAAPGEYIVSAGAYQDNVPLAPYVDHFITLQIR